jgi:predicted GTPase
MAKNKTSGTQLPPHQPDNHSSVQGGANSHTHNQWVLQELTKLISSNAVLTEKISTHNDDLKEIKTDVKKINNKILIASTVIVVAGAFATFFFGSSLSEIIDSLSALKDTSTK